MVTGSPHMWFISDTEAVQAVSAPRALVPIEHRCRGCSRILQVAGSWTCWRCGHCNVIYPEPGDGR